MRAGAVLAYVVRSSAERTTWYMACTEYMMGRSSVGGIPSFLWQTNEDFETETGLLDRLRADHSIIT